MYSQSVLKGSYDHSCIRHDLGVNLGNNGFKSGLLKLFLKYFVSMQSLKFLCNQVGCINIIWDLRKEIGGLMTKQPLVGKTSGRLLHDCHCFQVSSLCFQVFLYLSWWQHGTTWPVPLAAAYNMGNADSLSRRGPAPSVTCCCLHTRVKSNPLVTLAVRELQPYCIFAMLKSRDYSKAMFIWPVFHIGEPKYKKIANYLSWLHSSVV